MNFRSPESDRYRRHHRSYRDRRYQDEIRFDIVQIVLMLLCYIFIIYIVIINYIYINYLFVYLVGNIIEKMILAIEIDLQVELILIIEDIPLHQYSIIQPT